MEILKGIAFVKNNIVERVLKGSPNMTNNILNADQIIIIEDDNIEIGSSI
jgi:adenylate kinase